MPEKERCGQMFGTLTCDRECDHDGNHRGYLEIQDEPVFWPNKERAISDFWRFARRQAPLVPERTVRALAHAIGQFISVDEAQDALRETQAELAKK